MHTHARTRIQLRTDDSIVSLGERDMALAAESIVGMLELLQLQKHRHGETVTVFCVGAGDGREQMVVAAACSAKDWEGPAVKFVGIEIDDTALKTHQQVSHESG